MRRGMLCVLVSSSALQGAGRVLILEAKNWRNKSKIKQN